MAEAILVLCSLPYAHKMESVESSHQNSRGAEQPHLLKLAMQRGAPRSQEYMQCILHTSGTGAISGAPVGMGARRCCNDRRQPHVTRGEPV